MMFIFEILFLYPYKNSLSINHKYSDCFLFYALPGFFDWIYLQFNLRLFNGYVYNYVAEQMQIKDLNTC